MAIEIKFLSNVFRFLKGTSDMGDALDDVADSLDDVAREAKRAGDKAGDEIADGLEDAAQEGDRAVERLERSFKDMADQARQSSGQAGTAMKREFHEGTSAAKRDLGELGDEAKQNASETFSSFDGSIESLVDGIQGTLGGVISNIGPAGAVAGAAAAIGVGLLTAELQKSAERAAEIRQETSDLAKELIASGGALDASTVADRLKEWSFEIQDNKEWWELWQQSSTTNLAHVEDLAAATGLSFQDLFDAMSGQDATKSLDLIDDMETKAAALDKQLASLGAARAGGTARYAELKKERDGYRDSAKAIRERMGIEETATDEARKYAEATKDSAKEAERAAAAEEARTDAISSLQSSFDEVINSYDKYISKDRESADPEAYIQAMRRRSRATRDFNGNVQALADEFGLSQDEIQALLDQGVDFAPMLDSVMNSSPKLREEFVQAWRGAVGGGQAVVDGEPITATVSVNADSRNASAQLNATADQKRTAEINTKADTDTASQDLKRIATAKYTAKIKAVADTAAANTALNTLVRRREAEIVVKLKDREGREIK